MQNCVFPLMDNFFPLLGKRVVISKVICFNYGKYHSNNDKIVSTDKICASTSDKYASTTGKDTFTGKNIMCF